MLDHWPGGEAAYDLDGRAAGQGLFGGEELVGGRLEPPGDRVPTGLGLAEQRTIEDERAGLTQGDDATRQRLERSEAVRCAQRDQIPAQPSQIALEVIARQEQGACEIVRSMLFGAAWPLEACLAQDVVPELVGDRERAALRAQGLVDEWELEELARCALERADIPQPIDPDLLAARLGLAVRNGGAGCSGLLIN